MPLLDFCPELAAGVAIGPVMRVGARNVQYVKNGLARRYFRLGVRESYFLSLCNGRRSLRDLSEELLEHFGTPRLSDDSLWKLVAQLMQRGLIKPALGGGQPAAAPPPPRVEYRRFGEVYIRLLDPTSTLPRITSLLSESGARLLALLLIASAVLAETLALPHTLTLWHSVGTLMQTPNWAAIAWFAVFMFLAMALHEMAHALVCVRSGGRVDDLGLMFRYLMFFPYCRLDDLVLLQRPQRIASVVAGVVVNLALMLPFAIVSWLSGANQTLMDVSVLVLTFYNISCLMNLLPFLRLDGYLLISVCQGKPELKQDAFNELRRAVTSFFKGHHPFALQWGLIGFAVAYLLVTWTSVGWSIYRWALWCVTFRSPLVLALPVLVLLLGLRSQQARSGDQS